MEIRFYIELDEEKIYQVHKHGEIIFTGTKEECQRFCEVHLEKVKRGEPNKSRSGHAIGRIAERVCKANTRRTQQ